MIAAGLPALTRYDDRLMIIGHLVEGRGQSASEFAC